MRVPTPPLRQRLLSDLSGLAPAYFGRVMPSGTVSIAAHLQGWSWHWPRGA